MLRFAPSPTGDMDINDLRVAIFNYVLAQQRNDQFLVRIDDTDSKRNIEGKDTEIMMILEKFAIKHDRVSHQSEHLGLHQTLAIRLLQEGKAFVCTCADQCSGICENLDREDYRVMRERAEPFVLRLKNPDDAVDSFVILKNDGTPTANFAAACADMLSNIDCIVSGEDQRHNLSEQTRIKQALGYNVETEHVYLPTLINDSLLVKSLFEEGFIPDAILNYLLLMGNSNLPQEIFTLPEAIEWFDMDDIAKSEISFEMEKLRAINREHLKRMDDKRLSALFGFADADIGKLAKLYLEEVSTINELEAKVRPIFTPKNFDGAWAEEMRLLADIIAKAPAFESFDGFKQHLIQESGIGEDKLLRPLTLLLTGSEQAPQLGDVYSFIKSYILEVAS